MATFQPITDSSEYRTRSRFDIQRDVAETETAIVRELHGEDGYIRMTLDRGDGQYRWRRIFVAAAYLQGYRAQASWRKRYVYHLEKDRTLTKMSRERRLKFVRLMKGMASL